MELFPLLPVSCFLQQEAYRFMGAYDVLPVIATILIFCILSLAIMIAVPKRAGS